MLMIRKNILNWGKVRWPENPPTKLEEIGQKEVKLKDALMEMERFCYGENFKYSFYNV